MAGSSARKQLQQQIDAIEGAYEFSLAYAAQGLTKEAEGTSAARQFRKHLDGMAQATVGLAATLAELLDDEAPENREQLEAFRAVLDADATAASVTIQLVQSQKVATSQLVDNMNASVHVRTLLTDLFLLDEALGLGVDKLPSAEPQTSDSAS